MPGTSASKPLSAEVPRPTEVRLLGAPRLFANESQTAFASERRFQLLAFLAVQTGRWIPRDRLAVLLWPDREAGAARGNLRTLIHRARRLPGADGLEVAEQVLRWSVRCDVAEFEAAASIGRHDEALALYGGPLLDGLDDHANPAWMEWLGAERARLGSLCQRVAHERLASLNAPDRAALAERLLAMDPMDEAAFEVLLRAEMDRGRPWQAQRLYRAHAQQLAEQLGLEPSRRLRELMHEAGEAARAQPAGVAVMRQTDPATPSQARDAADARAELVGRRTELAELCALLVDPESRCLTLLGPGGVGKSRLAREAVARTAPQFPGAVAWVDLQDLQRPEEVYARLVRQLNLGALNEKEPVGQIAKLIGASRSLLVLDNAEHLEGLPSLLQGLMEACSGLCLLLTSRARLNVNGERLTVLGGLITPEASEDPEAAATFDAVQLFARVARRADPKFELREHVATVACIARQVDGMPLALELAAGWVRLMTPDQIMQDLAGSLDVLERHPAAHGAQAAALGRPEHAKLRDVLAEASRFWPHPSSRR